MHVLVSCKTADLLSVRFSLSVVLIVLIQVTAGQVDKVCNQPLGMQDKRILDLNLKATSSYTTGTGPSYARLRRDEGDGGWCPKSSLTPGKEDQYLQVELPHRYFVTKIATQGRYAHGSGNEFVRSYKVRYSRDGKIWKAWSDPRGVNILQGNVDTNTVKQQVLDPGLAGVKYLRIVPVSNRESPVCLRVELYGCLWRSGLVSYKMPAPADYSPFRRVNSATMYSDDTYDGNRRDTYFTGGLGQLTDGVIGDEILSKTKSLVQTSAIGYDYVGWSQKVGDNRTIIMMFAFDEVKNFTSMRVHCHSDNLIGSRLFSSIKLQYSLNGRKYYRKKQIDKKAQEARLSAGSSSPTRFLTIPLDNLIGRYLKATFKIDGKYLLFSEIEFYNTNIFPKGADEDTTFTEKVEVLGNAPTEPEDKSLEYEIIEESEGPEKDKKNNGKVFIIVGVLTAVVVLLLCVLVMTFYFRKRRSRKRSRPCSSRYPAVSLHGDQVITVAPLIGPTASGENHVAVERKEAMPIYHEIGPTFLPPDNLYLEPRDVVGASSSSQPVQSSSANGGPSSQQALSSCRINSKKISHYAETDIFLPCQDEETLQGVSGNNKYAIPWNSPLPPKTRRSKKKEAKEGITSTLHGSSSTRNLPRDLIVEGLHIDPSDLPPELPRESLKFVEKLGEGQFGEVQLCKADACLRALVEDEDYHLAGPENAPVLVAVKVLRAGASNNAKENFLKEVRIMSRLDDPNIVRLLAVCTADEPYAMVTEYMENGDLNQYLRSFDDDMSTVPVPGKKLISNDVILHMAIQITSGMSYLSSLHFVHRDLATRNCLVGSNNAIRIGDFGMSRNIYQSDYYRIQGRAVLPIRWMSWECVLMGKFSHSSDVWSFGVTLWEMFSLCKYQPHGALSDQDVIENMHHIFRQTKEEVNLPRPKRCPSSIFNMIRKCWKRACEERPTFPRLHSYLVQKQLKPSPKPKRPQVKPPTPKSRTLSIKE